MASPRITNTMRDGIIKNTIDATFTKERVALDKQERTLAAKAHKELYPPAIQKAFETLGELANRDDGIRLNIRGMAIYLGYGVTVDGSRIRLPMGDKHTGYGFRFTPSQKLSDEIYEYVTLMEDLKSRIEKATVQLRATLESVQSFKKLRAVWPQGEKFYDMYDVDSETKADVPSVVIPELNKILNLK